MVLRRLFSSNKERLETRFGKWFLLVTFLVCTTFVLYHNKTPKHQTSWVYEWLIRNRILLLLIPLPHFWTGSAALFEKKEKISYNLAMKKKELTQILQEGDQRQL
jgi:hypothetical protein